MAVSSSAKAGRIEVDAVVATATTPARTSWKSCLRLLVPSSLVSATACNGKVDREELEFGVHATARFVAIAAHVATIKQDFRSC